MSEHRIEDEASVERNLRHLTKGSGFDFKKSTTTPGATNRGGFQLFQIATNKVVAGTRYELELRDVAIHLQRLGILGYGGA